MTALTRSVIVSGMDGVLVDVQTTVHAGLHTGHRFDSAAVSGVEWCASRDALRELRERVRAATMNSRLSWPVEPVAVELTPADRVPAPSACDLAVAVGVQVAVGKVVVDRLADTVLLGELGLDGSIRRVRGVLPALLAAHRAGIRQAVVPRSALAEAACAPGIVSYGADHLSEVISWLSGTAHLTPTPPAPIPPRPSRSERPVAGDGPQPINLADMAYLLRHPQARRAIDVAAAGGHHIALTGAPGTGKTALARRLHGLLPALTAEQARETTVIRSLAGTLDPDEPLTTIPPFVAPHHSTSVAALVGGGTGIAKPGAITLAHHGLLFLDDAAEFGTQKLEAVRTALAGGEIRLARRDGVVVYPSHFQLVLAASPCSCAADRDSDCLCSPSARRRYLARLSGPLLHRVDLRVRLRSSTNTGDGQAPLRRANIDAVEPFAVARARVAAARARAAARWGHGSATNAAAPSEVVDRASTALPRTALALLTDAVMVGALSKREANGSLRVAWTLADLDGADHPSRHHVEQALRLRHRQASGTASTTTPPVLTADTANDTANDTAREREER